MSDLKTEHGLEAAKLDVGNFTIASTPIKRQSTSNNQNITTDIVLTIQGVGLFLFNLSENKTIDAWSSNVFQFVTPAQYIARDDSICVVVDISPGQSELWTYPMGVDQNKQPITRALKHASKSKVIALQTWTNDDVVVSYEDGYIERLDGATDKMVPFAKKINGRVIVQRFLMLPSGDSCLAQLIKQKDTSALRFVSESTVSEAIIEKDVSDFDYDSSRNYIILLESNRKLSIEALVFEKDTVSLETVHLINLSPRRISENVRLASMNNGALLMITQGSDAIKMLLWSIERGVIMRDIFVSDVSEVRKLSVNAIDDTNVFVSFGNRYQINSLATVPDSLLDLLQSQKLMKTYTEADNASKYQSIRETKCAFDFERLLMEELDKQTIPSNELSVAGASFYQMNHVNPGCNEFVDPALIDIVNEKMFQDETFYSEKVVMALIKKQALSPNSIKKMVAVMIKKKHWDALYLILHNLNSVPETDLATILKAVLSASEEEICASLSLPPANICFPFQQDGEKDETIHEALFRCIIMYPVTPILMVRALKSLNAQQVRLCLEMSQKWLERFQRYSLNHLRDQFIFASNALGSQSDVPPPKLIQQKDVVEFLNVLVDAHVTYFMLSVEDYPLVEQLTNLIREEVQVCSEMDNISGLLAHYEIVSKDINQSGKASITSNMTLYTLEHVDFTTAY